MSAGKPSQQTRRIAVLEPQGKRLSPARSAKEQEELRTALVKAGGKLCATCGTPVTDPFAEWNGRRYCQAHWPEIERKQRAHWPSTAREKELC